MTYLAEITSVNRLNNKVRAILLGKKRPDGLWISAPGSEINLPNVRNLNERQLVLLELNSDLTPVSIVAASDRLVECLREWSLRTSRIDSDTASNELSKESLKYQSVKLYQRDEELKRREEVQLLKEKSLESLLVLAQDKLDAADAQHVELTKAWKHLYYREEQLKEN